MNLHGATNGTALGSYRLQFTLAIAALAAPPHPLPLVDCRKHFAHQDGKTISLFATKATCDNTKTTRPFEPFDGACDPADPPWDEPAK